MREHEIETLSAEISARRNEEEAGRYGDPSLMDDRDEEEEEYHGVAR